MPPYIEKWGAAGNGIADLELVGVLGPNGPGLPPSGSITGSAAGWGDESLFGSAVNEIPLANFNYAATGVRIPYVATCSMVFPDEQYLQL